MEGTMTTLVELTQRKRGTRCCAETDQVQLSTTDARQLSDDLQILGHPIRLQLLTILARSSSQVCVCDLEAAVPVKQPTVSHHLRLLREAGLIDCERHGLWAYYFVQRDALAALRARISGQLELLV
jgi:ArsR family transcriptional regulator, arsenate/arsenite/antimonite-responsive transcriptional repressor